LRSDEQPTHSKELHNGRRRSQRFSQQILGNCKIQHWPGEAKLGIRVRCGYGHHLRALDPYRRGCSRRAEWSLDTRSTRRLSRLTRQDVLTSNLIEQVKLQIPKSHRGGR